MVPEVSYEIKQRVEWMLAVEKNVVVMVKKRQEVRSIVSGVVLIVVDPPFDPSFDFPPFDFPPSPPSPPSPPPPTPPQRRSGSNILGAPPLRASAEGT